MCFTDVRISIQTAIKQCKGAQVGYEHNLIAPIYYCPLGLRHYLAFRHGIENMLRILYVEDNPDSFRPVKRIAAYEGYELYTAETVKAGLSIIQNHSPTLILLDMHLPDGTAVEFTRQVREQGLTCPIVVITGYTFEKERDACFTAGCTEFLIKPVEVHTFIELFQRYNEDRIP